MQSFENIVVCLLLLSSSCFKTAFAIVHVEKRLDKCEQKINRIYYLVCFSTSFGKNKQ